MKKLFLSSLALFALLSAYTPLHAHTIASDDGISCSIGEMSIEEVQDFFHNKEVASFRRSVMLFQDAIAAAADNGRPRGSFVTADEAARQMAIDKLHETYVPYRVKIENNTDKEIIVGKNAYISTWKKAIVSTAKVVEQYPDFASHKYGIGFLSALLTGVSLFTGYCGIHTKDIALRWFCGAATVIGLLATIGGINLVKWAKRLEIKKANLLSFAPVLTIARGDQKSLTDQSFYRIPAGAVFEDILILHAQTMQTSSAVFGGGQAPALEVIS